MMLMCACARCAIRDIGVLFVEVHTDPLTPPNSACTVTADGVVGGPSKSSLTTENLLENTDGVLQRPRVGGVGSPYKCSLGAVACCYFLFMLTRAISMTSLFHRRVERPPALKHRAQAVDKARVEARGTAWRGDQSKRSHRPRHSREEAKATWRVRAQGHLLVAGGGGGGGDRASPRS